MRHYAALFLALAVAVHAIPFDETSARNNAGGHANSTSAATSKCPSSSTDCNTPGSSLPKIASGVPENTGKRDDTLAQLGLSAGTLRGSHNAESGELPKINGGAPGNDHPAVVELDSDKVGPGGGTFGRNSSWLVD